MQRMPGPISDLVGRGFTGLELSLTLVGGGGVSPVDITVGFNIAEEFGPGMAAVDETVLMEHSGFQGGHKGFRPGMVIGRDPRGDPLADAGADQEAAAFTAGVLVGAIAVEDDAAGRSG